MRLEEEKSERELATPTSRDLRHIAQMNTDKKKEKELTTIPARRDEEHEGKKDTERYLATPTNRDLRQITQIALIRRSTEQERLEV